MINGNKRTYGKVKEISVEKLTRVFQEIDIIKAAVLFGSRAETDQTTSNSKSDYDFGVLLDKSVPSAWGHLANARVAIGQKLQLPDTDFDVVDLEIASTELKRSIRANFLILKGFADDILRLLG